MERKLVFLSGVGSSKSSGENVVNAAVSEGWVDDGDAYTPRQAKKMSPDKLRQRIQIGGVLWTHSAGILYVPSEVKVHEAAIFAGPEKRSVPRLLKGSMQKTWDHIFAETDYSRREHLRVAAHTTAFALRDVLSLPEIAKFSTTEHIAAATHVNPENTRVFSMSEDRFFPGSHNIAAPVLRNLGCHVQEIEGGHDDMMVDPSAVLQVAGLAQK